MSILETTDWQNTNFRYLFSPDESGTQSSWENQTFGQNKLNYSRHDSKKIPETWIIYVSCF